MAVLVSITYGHCAECFSRSWNVVVSEDDGDDIPTATWSCRTKAAAIKVARKVFNDYTTAKELRVETRAGTFDIIRGGVVETRAGTFDIIRSR